MIQFIAIGFVAQILAVVSGAALSSNEIAVEQSFEIVCQHTHCDDPILRQMYPAVPHLTKRQQASPPVNRPDANWLNLTATSPDGMVSFDVSCNLNQTDASTCNKVETSLESVAERVAKAIKFAVPIRVQMLFYNLCTDPFADADCGEVLGAASPSQVFKLTGVPVPQAMYPQALVRQVLPRRSTDASLYGQYDIQMSFNSFNVKWHFYDDGDRIDRNAYDFEYVALHEFTHGLGFYSLINVRLYSDTAISVQEFGNVGTAPSNSFYQTIFDHYLAQIQGGSAQSSLGQEVTVSQWTSFDDAQVDLVNNRNVLQQFARTPGGTIFNYVPSSSIFDSLALPKRVLVDGSAAVLYTPRNFQNGSSVTHLDQNLYIDSRDFLMTPRIIMGVRLDQLLTQRGLQDVSFGPRVLRILSSMGYTLTDAARGFSAQTGGSSLVTINWYSVVGAVAASLLVATL
ncbi:hypothetical protein MP228_008948 [Amoeboaphelidium protococcarum]|nr:hypothetical protein MP228_008948 [Amoeboaphelidium protococcarum]